MDASVDFAKHLLQTVVNVHATAPRGHPSSRILGSERMGSGVIVDPGGLILTVNYVVMGAQTVDVAFVKGRRVKAEVVAQDFEIGIAVLRVKRQGLVAAPVTSTTELERGEPVVAVASTAAQERRIAGGMVTYLGEFEAYWEYLLERGIVCSAQNPGFGGGGLYSMTGALLGIVSLDAQEVASRKELYLSLWRHEPGERLTLEVLRDNKSRRVEVTTGDRAEFFKQT